MVKWGWGKEDWWLSCRGEGDAHCTSCWGERGALLFSIALHFLNSDEQSKRDPRCKIQTEDVHESQKIPSTFWILVESIHSFILSQQPRSVRSARCRSPSTGCRGGTGAASSHWMDPSPSSLTCAWGLDRFGKSYSVRKSWDFAPTCTLIGECVYVSAAWFFFAPYLSGHMYIYVYI